MGGIDVGGIIGKPSKSSRMPLWFVSSHSGKPGVASGLAVGVGTGVLTGQGVLCTSLIDGSI